jgi:hypothetical protein
MTQPTGFEDPEIAGKVCKLLESIYGLKHASRSWNLRFDKEVKTLTSSDAKKNLMCTKKKTSGSAIAFLNLICR